MSHNLRWLDVDMRSQKRPNPLSFVGFVRAGHHKQQSSYIVRMHISVQMWASFTSLCHPFLSFRSLPLQSSCRIYFCYFFVFRLFLLSFLCHVVWVMPKQNAFEIALAASSALPVAQNEMKIENKSRIRTEIFVFIVSLAVCVWNGEGGGPNRWRKSIVKPNFGLFCKSIVQGPHTNRHTDDNTRTTRAVKWNKIEWMEMECNEKLLNRFEFGFFYFTFLLNVCQYVRSLFFLFASHFP